MKNILLALFITLFIASCSSDEKLIDESKDTYDFLVSSADGSLARYSMPDMVLQSSDIYKNLFNETLPVNNKVIREFRDSIYVVLPELKRIDVIAKWTLKKVHTIDFSTLNLTPNDIDFANATEAYVIHSDGNSVSQIDLTNFAILKQIPVGEKPVAIKAIGNQIYVANQTSSTVSVIDSRTKTVTATISVETAPTFIDVKYDASQAIILSLGAGKVDANAKTAASVTFINVSTRNITKVVNTFYPTAISKVATEVVVNSFTAGDNSYIYLATDKGLLRMDTKKNDKFSQVSKNVYDKVFYNTRLSKLFAYSNTLGIQILNTGTGAVTSTIDCPLTIQNLYAY